MEPRSRLRARVLGGLSVLNVVLALLSVVLLQVEGVAHAVQVALGWLLAASVTVTCMLVLLSRESLPQTTDENRRLQGSVREQDRVGRAPEGRP